MPSRIVCQAYAATGSHLSRPHQRDSIEQCTVHEYHGKHPREVEEWSMRFSIVLVLIMAVVLPTRVGHAATPELRAFWVDAFHAGIKTPAQTTQLVADAQRAGANTLIVQVRRRADSYFRNSAEPIATDAEIG